MSVLEAHASAVRRRQVVALAEFVAEHRGETPFPAVVTGDFNAWPDDDEIRLFGGYHTAPTVAGHPCAGRPGPNGLGRVRAVRRAGDAPVEGTWPSDHTVVVADLTGDATGTP